MRGFGTFLLMLGLALAGAVLFGKPMLASAITHTGILTAIPVAAWGCLIVGFTLRGFDSVVYPA
ncbi:MAG: hypothetical protein IT567_02000 [Alphaproteobacteria bacterium]|nr:hypothetical protein [Alphaproteobacteria bacterium]